MKNYFFLKKIKTGFTIIELLVAMAVFLIIVVALIGVFVSAMRVQQKTLAIQQMMNQASYVLEYTSRYFRMAQKDTSGSCVSAGVDYVNPDGDASKIKFLDYNSQCQEFYLQSGKIYQQKIGIDANGVPVTSDKFNVSNLKFNIIDNTGSQPRVTISFEMAEKGGAQGANITVQTTTSQRNLNLSQSGQASLSGSKTSQGLGAGSTQ